jgi:hypothetical protein
MAVAKKSLFERIPLIMPVFILIAALYAGWIFYSRWRDDVAAQRAAAVQEAERARKDVELNGGTQLKITMLYASPGVVRKGQTAQICYGVVNAKNVAFVPPIEGVWPSMNRCVTISPKKSVTYTLSASDGAGHADKAQVSVEVK